MDQALSCDGGQNMSLVVYIHTCGYFLAPSGVGPPATERFDLIEAVWGCSACLLLPAAAACLCCRRWLWRRLLRLFLEAKEMASSRSLSSPRLCNG